MVSLSAVPLIESLPSVPLRVAMSDHPDVWRHHGCGALYGCHELRIGAACAICVVIELSGGRVVDHAIVGIVARRCASGRIEPRIACTEPAGAAQSGERGGVEAQAVPIV